MRCRRATARARAPAVSDRNWTEPLPILTWLIEHPEGLILVDTGETPRVKEPGYFTSWHPFFRLGLKEWVAPQEAVGAQIERLGFSREDVRHALVTHFHTDHAGGIGDLPASEIIASKKDYDYSKGFLGKHSWALLGRRRGRRHHALLRRRHDYTEQLMLDGVVDGVSADVAAAHDSLARIQRLTAERPTVYLPTHDPLAPARLARRQVTTAKAVA